MHCFFLCSSGCFYFPFIWRCLLLPLPNFYLMLWRGFNLRDRIGDEKWRVAKFARLKEDRRRQGIKCHMIKWQAWWEGIFLRGFYSVSHGTKSPTKIAIVVLQFYLDRNISWRVSIVRFRLDAILFKKKKINK